jgi:Zn-dependent peptidase ImmA (M78 family)
MGAELCRRNGDYPAHWKSSSVLPPILANELADIAKEMRSHEERTPVLLREICKQLGIRIVRSASVQPGKAYLEWDRAAERAPIIRLPSREALSWDRFCAAHELGHYVLMERFSYHPQTDSEYWQTEVLCDFFARELLLPDSLFPDTFEQGGELLIAGCDQLSRTAKVPWIQVAKKISRRFPNTFLMRLGLGADGLLKVSATSLPLEKGRGRKIDSRTSFGIKARDALEEAKTRNSCVALECSRDDFLGTRLGELFSELAVERVFLKADRKGASLALAAVR